MWERKLQPFERSIHPCIHLQGWMFAWPVDPVRGRQDHNDLLTAYWEWYTFAISVANVSKGAAIVTSRTRTLLLPSQTSEQLFASFFAMEFKFSWLWFFRLSPVQPRATLSGRRCLALNARLRDPLEIRHSWRLLEWVMCSVDQTCHIIWPQLSPKLDRNTSTHMIQMECACSFVPSSVRIWYVDLLVVMRVEAKDSS